MNEVIEKEFYELIPKEDIEFLIKFDEYKKRAKVIEEDIKQKAHDFLQRNGLTEYTQDMIHIYETKPYTKKQLDIMALKEQGLYDSFVRDIEVKGSVRIDIKYDD